MGPTLVMLAPDGPHVGPMNLAIRVDSWDPEQIRQVAMWDTHIEFKAYKKIHKGAKDQPLGLFYWQNLAVGMIDYGCNVHRRWG